MLEASHSAEAETCCSAMHPCTMTGRMHTLKSGCACTLLYRSVSEQVSSCTTFTCSRHDVAHHVLQHMNPES